VPLQKRRGMDCAAQANTAVSRIFSMPTILSYEFQNLVSLLRKLPIMRSSAGPKSHAGISRKYSGPGSQKFFSNQFAARDCDNEIALSASPSAKDAIRTDIDPPALAACAEQGNRAAPAISGQE
jgi:hypothetical protein